MDQLPVIQNIRNNIRSVIIGKDETINLLLTALLCSGHVLIEDMPGMGKTTLVSAMAASLGCSFRRIQFTPDVLPADITGFNMFNMKTGEQELHMGSILHQIVLADEINRTSPKTQSALLEVMQENQVTIDGQTYPAPSPFMVLATQNPVEMTGTYPLPEAQMDRFLMRVSMGADPSPSLQGESGGQIASGRYGGGCSADAERCGKHPLFGTGAGLHRFPGGSHPRPGGSGDGDQSPGEHRSDAGG